MHELDPDVPPSTSSFTTILPRPPADVASIFYCLASLLVRLCSWRSQEFTAFSPIQSRAERVKWGRMALGASAANVLRLVLGQASVTAIVGVCLGLVGSFILMRFLRSMLFEVGAADPLTFAAVALLLFAVALLAATSGTSRHQGRPKCGSAI